MPINKIIIQKLLFVFTWVFLVTYCKCNTHVCVKKNHLKGATTSSQLCIGGDCGSEG